MLKHAGKIYGLIIVLLQIWLISHLQLFGDEAFYWLEGQHLDLSYAELPGWNAWMIRLGTEIFGNNYFAVRFFSYCGYISLYWVINLILQTLNPETRSKTHNNSSLAIVIIPLLVLIATMALPDIWLLVFSLWSSYFLLKAIKFNAHRDWIILGILIALSLNVHIRMWFWLFFAGIAFLLVFFSQKERIKSALLKTLPIALAGLIPIVIFNQNHDYPLLSFQLSQRHPWYFQMRNISFLLSQFVVITPLIMLLWFKRVFLLDSNASIKWLIMTAVLHWLFYVVMSFFVDGFRTNVHWLIISYVPVLILTHESKLKTWAFISGGVVSLVLLLFLSFNSGENSLLQARLLDNSLGWKQLANEIKVLQKELKTKNIIADYFMTGAELAFEMNGQTNIKVLSHKKNRKHGREKQLEIMGMLLNKPQEYHKKALLVIEDSTLKLQEKGKYYHRLCQYFKPLQYLKAINIDHSNKQFHLFKINNNGTGNHCEIPAIFYTDYKYDKENITLSGWVILHQVGIKELIVRSGDFSRNISQKSMTNTGIQAQFPEINDPNLPNNGFKITIPLAKITQKNFSLIAIGNNNKKYYSQIYFIN